MAHCPCAPATMRVPGAFVISAAARPETIETSATPASRARRQAFSFASMPECAAPLAAIRSISSTASSARLLPLPSRTPGVVPAMISRPAPSMADRCAAMTSALTFSSVPSASTPMLQTIGMHPICSRSRSSETSPGWGSPTSPRSTRSPETASNTAARLESPMNPSAPVSPMARPPAAPTAATRLVLVRPASTEITASSVG